MEENMMTTKMTWALACCAALVLSNGVFAQQRSTPAPKEHGDLDEIRKISTLIGTPVKNSANHSIAEIKDLVLTPEGALRYAVLSCGGVAGIGQTYTAIPFDCLKVRHDDGKWTAGLDMTADDLKKAPTIHSANYRELTDAKWVDSDDRFFHPGDRSNARPRPEAGDTQGQAHPVKWVLLASKIRSAKLKNKQNQDLGQVEDLLLDRDDSVVFTIIGRGGVLGIGEDYIPIPWARFGINTNREDAAVTLLIDDSKAHLEKAPLVKGDNYATMLAPGFAEQVRRYFGVTTRASSSDARRESP
jgi:hypothetical protein